MDPLAIDDMQPKLAAELAAGLLPVADILKRFDLTKTQLKILLHNAVFVAMVKDMREQWEGASNAKERIRVKAALAVEEGLQDLYNIYINPELNLTARLDAYKQLVVLADAAPKKDAPDALGPQFSVVFNIPGANEPLTIQGSSIKELNELEEE